MSSGTAGVSLSRAASTRVHADVLEEPGVVADHDQRARGSRPSADTSASYDARSRLLVGSSSMSSCGAGSASSSAASVARNRSPPDSVRRPAGRPRRRGTGTAPAAPGPWLTSRRARGQHVVDDAQVVVEHVEPLGQQRRPAPAAHGAGARRPARRSCRAAWSCPRRWADDRRPGPARAGRGRRRRRCARPGPGW